MNMKKTIAAVAACAVAVSAMATTVSADTNTLHYNLVKNVYKNEGTITFTAMISNVDTSTAANVVINLTDGTSGKINLTGGAPTYVVTGYNVDPTNKVKTDVFSFTLTNKDAKDKLNRSDWVSEDGKTITIPVAANSAEGIVAGNTYITVTLSTTCTDASMNTYNNGATYFEANGEKMSTRVTAFDSKWGTLEAQYPMVTDYNTTTSGTKITTPANPSVWGAVYEDKNGNILGSSSNILAYLQDDQFNLSANGKSYVNVAAVLNDVIANFDDVTFTFNTATSGIKNGKYSTDYDADNTYKSFGQHLYNLYGDENTNLVYKDYVWTGYNLFSGALIINGSLSMSLNNTEVFDYSATSLSFNWEDVTDGANVNTYVTYLQKMQLATSTTWYWDSMDVVYGNTESDDVNSGEGTDAEEDVIADDTSDEEIADDTTVDEEPADEEVPAEDEAPAEEAPAEEAPADANPATGNAPIALAVIPVALAAAAVVAKKRG